VEEFVRGPLFCISIIIFIVGFIYRALRLIQLTEKTEIPSLPVAPVNPKKKPEPPVVTEEQQLEKIARFQNSVLVRHPVMTVVSTMFHICLFVTPILLLAHNVMLRSAIGIGLPSIPDGLADLLTIAVMGGGLFFLVRRIAVPKVAAISGGYDYLVLLLTIAPYLTGFLAYHHLLNYRTMITLHILAGNILLIALPFTKVGHMVFFFFSRIYMAGEFCLGRGTRTWKTEARTQE
jgi:nitrate reductase gamma subunit